MDFAEAYGVGHRVFCYLVVAATKIVMFGGMCHYDDASGLLWSNIRFEADGSAFEITFDKRKNAQLRQGNKVLVASSPLSSVCHVRLLRELKTYTGRVRGIARTCFGGLMDDWSPRARALQRWGRRRSHMINSSAL